jgi:uncharacterized protein YxjI
MKSVNSGSSFDILWNGNKSATVMQRGFTIPQKVDLVDVNGKLSATGSNAFISVGGTMDVVDCAGKSLGKIIRENDVIFARYTVQSANGAHLSFKVSH